ncbi:MAG: alpha/beta fold hydrolase [Bacteroidota bacterium]
MKTKVMILLFLTISLKIFGVTSNGAKGKFSYADSLLTYKNKNGQKVPVKTIADWQQKRNQVLAGMQKVMGPLPAMKGLPPLDIQYIDSLKEDNFTCYNIKFTVAANEVLPALLYIPYQKGKPKKLAALVVLHGTDVLGKKILSGISPKPNRAYAKELAQRGYVVIAPDYPSFGDMADYDFKTDRYQSGTMKAIFNHMRCVDLLQARPDVDANRVGAIGHSLGGHNAIFLAAFDKRIKVTVASCGWTLFDSYNAGDDVTKKYGGKLGPWAQDRYMPLIRDKYNLDVAQMPFDFDEVIATLAPRPFFSNSPLNDANFNNAGVKKGISNISKVYTFFNAPANLQVRYPEATHDFPPAVRLEAYQFIDKVLKHTPTEHQLLP